MLSSILHPLPPHPTGSVTTAFLLLDLFAVVVVARFLGNVANRFGQPRAVGEIVAGILLGPTLIGADLSRFLVPVEVRPVLSGIASVALVLFMFLVGVEFDRSILRGREGEAVALGLLSVAVPAAAGFPIGVWMHHSRYAGPAGASLLAFVLFVGACLSVTALPVIAHVLLERGELNSRVGGIAIACSAVASVAMFTYIALATAVAAARGYAGFLVKLGLIVVAAVGVRFLLRPVVRWLLLRSRSPGGGVTADTMAVVFGGLFLFALAADRIGVNLMVGAFVWGVVMPANRTFRLALAGRLADVARVLFLPVFFAYSGLFTDLRLLTPSVLPILGVVLAASVLSKFTAAVPGRLYGMSWRETFQLGALINTRGLVLLVVGLIGLELGIITQATYTILVVVALITNLMTGPLMDALAVRLDGAQRSDLGGAAVSQVAGGF